MGQRFVEMNLWSTPHMNVSGLVWEMIPWWILGVVWVFLDGGLPSVWILLIYPEFIFCLQCLLLAIFHPLTPTLLLGCKFRSPITYLELSSSSLPKCQNSIWKAEFSSEIEYVVSVCDAPSPVCFSITKIIIPVLPTPSILSLLKQSPSEHQQ